MPFLLAWLMSLLIFINVPIKQIDPRVEPYYNEFMGIVKNECPNLETPRQFIVGFGTLRNEEIGLCYTYSVRREIKFDESFWEITPEYGRKQLVFHELTHCVLNVHHIDNDKNYMNPYLIYIPESDLIDQLQQNARSVCNE